jgi:tetratricopeptide (TPR) repeat protein
MQNGNSSSAIYWANWIIWHTPSNHPSHGYGYECRAQAYELAGEYEKALEDYIKAESLSNRAPFVPSTLM